MGGVTTQTIDYTGDGNMANLNPGIQAPGGSLITSLGRNQNARLSAVKSGSNILARYDYDGFGQRVVKTLSATDVTLYQYGQEGMLLEEATYKGVPLADYIYLDDRPIATLTPSGALYFLQDDMLGTPQIATDSSQNIAWQATYTPFGQASVSGTLTQNLRLPGQYFDSEGGWNHNGFRNYFPDLGRYAEPDPLAMQGSARYYDPSIGYLIGGDPMGFRGSRTNFYTYVHDNPINLIDPLGLCDKPENPCQYAGRAMAPSAYALAGQSAKGSAIDFALDVYMGWPAGQYLDAQPLASGTVQQRAAYGNYVFGVYMQAAGLTLSQTLSAANDYAALRSHYPSDTPMDPNYLSLPAANVENITNGYNAEQAGTICQP